MRCEDFLDGLTTLADGGTAFGASAHAEDCPACATKLAQLTRIVDAARHSVVDAPDDLVLRAQGFFQTRPRLVARLLGSGLANAGARRGGAPDFALHVGVEDFSIRLLYTPTRDGWEVLGRAPTADWSVSHEGGEVPCGASGRFRLLVSGLDRTMFTLRKDGTEIEVPSALEMTDRGS